VVAVKLFRAETEHHTTGDCAIADLALLHRCAVINDKVLKWVTVTKYGPSSGSGWLNGPPDMEGTRVYIEYRSRGQPIRGGPPAFEGGRRR